ncbi:unnamed protein product [Bursaphelenchus xylophilus]|uniref:(pine wood nematode) hypothetical protein n=1 Tax=Bursaphelenchus xylophilus TaxID=6326 RepID=A0A1I7RY65_BURXY|nr:unnamed protein product [Bursaphelenchus xylophilus]CAG9085348.1 unnamed protein product [Bursaphelenchus xylophilus]
MGVKTGRRKDGMGLKLKQLKASGIGNSTPHRFCGAHKQAGQEWKKAGKEAPPLLPAHKRLRPLEVVAWPASVSSSTLRPGLVMSKRIRAGLAPTS